MEKFNKKNQIALISQCPHCDQPLESNSNAGDGQNLTSQLANSEQNTFLPTYAVEILEFCPHCQGILPLYAHSMPENRNYEPDYCAILGADSSAIQQHDPAQEATLEALWLRKLRHNHPDRYVNASPLSKEIAMHNAALCNRAYAILKDTRTKIAYFLRRAGYDLDSPLMAAKISQNDPGLAMRNFMLQEHCSNLNFKYRTAIKNSDLEATEQIRGALITEKQKLTTQATTLVNSICAMLHKAHQSSEASANTDYSDILRQYSELLFIDRAIASLDR